MQTAWDLIGFGGDWDGFPASVRIDGGRTLYEAVDYDDSRGGKLVRLSRLTNDMRQINRYVDPDTKLVIVLG